MLKKIWVNNTEDKNKCFAIREAVFVKEQGVPFEADFDGSDDNAQLLLITDNDVPAATGRCMPYEDGYTIGRVAVLKHLRGRGLGGEVVNSLCDYIFEELDVKRCYIHAQLQAKDFYLRLGFKPLGEVFSEAGIEHIAMVKEVLN